MYHFFSFSKKSDKLILKLYFIYLKIYKARVSDFILNIFIIIIYFIMILKLTIDLEKQNTDLNIIYNDFNINYMTYFLAVNLLK